MCRHEREAGRLCIYVPLSLEIDVSDTIRLEQEWHERNVSTQERARCGAAVAPEKRVPAETWGLAVPARVSMWDIQGGSEQA